MKPRMTNDLALNVIDALSNIAYASVEAGTNLDYMSAETTRVLSIYSDFIGTDLEGEKDKRIYEDAKLVMIQCEDILKLLRDTKESVLKLLKEVGNS